MKLSDYKKQMKEKMGWKWYWIQFILLFDFEHQYDMWLMSRHLHHMKKVSFYEDIIRKRNG
jgi:hypothetical protein